MNPSDAKARTEIATDFENNISVVASAGTGKTFLLVRRIANLILTGKVKDIRRIVALTFTEKAAAEMKVRLADFLEVAASGGLVADYLTPSNLPKPDQIVHNAEKAIRDLNKAHIGTIHSFCSNVLKQYPLEAGMSPGFAVDEGDQMAKIFDTKFIPWCREQLRLNSPNADKWRQIVARTQFADISSLTGEFCRRSYPADCSVDLGRPAKPRLTISARRTLEEIRNEIKAHPPALKQAKLDKLMFFVDSFFSFLDDLESARKNCKTPDLRPIQAKNEPQDYQDLYERLRKLRDSVSKSKLISLFEILNDEAIRLLIELLRPFLEEVDRTHSSNGLVSFNGLLTKTRNLLKREPQVRTALKRDIDAILIDEFQDTDPVQSEIILFLAEVLDGSAKNARDVRLAKGKLFVVGDPKQSIYSFRGADIEAYETVANIILGQNGLKRVLSDTFRTHDAMATSINAFFTPIFVKDPGIQPEYDPLVPSRNSDGTFQGVERIDIASGDGEPLLADEAREYEGRFIANWIRRNVGKTMISDSSGKRRKLAFNDISILFRKLTIVKPYVQSLKLAEIPYIIEGEKFFFRMQEVIDFCNLILAAHNPFDRLSLAAFLKTPYAGLSDHDIYLLLQNDFNDYRGIPNEAYRTLSSPDVAREAVGILVALNDDATRMPLDRFVGDVIERTHAIEIAARMYYGEQAVANIIKVHNLAKDCSPDPDMTLDKFASLLKTNITDPPEEDESPLSDEAYNAVKILSIHKSKGLEFPVVILPDLSGDPKPKGRGNNCTHYDSGSNILSIRLSELCNGPYFEGEERRTLKSDSEEIRVLYVGMTRAREKLLLIDTDRGDGKKMTYSNILLHAIGGGQTACSNTEIDIRSLSKLSGAKRKGIKVKKTDWTDFVSMWREKREEKERIAASSSNLPASAFEAEIDGAATVLADGHPLLPVLTGTAVHRYLQRHDFTAKPVVDHELLEISVRSCVPTGSPELEERTRTGALALLDGFIGSAEYVGISSSEILTRELPFNVLHDGVLVSGRIDLIYRDAAGIVTVVDYKTGGKSPEDGGGKVSEIYLSAVKNALGETKARYRTIRL